MVKDDFVHNDKSFLKWTETIYSQFIDYRLSVSNPPTADILCIGLFTHE